MLLIALQVDTYSVLKQESSIIQQTVLIPTVFVILRFTQWGMITNERTKILCETNIGNDL